MQGHPEAVEITRRSLLRLGLTGGAVLAVAGVGMMLTGCRAADDPVVHGYRFLRAADVELLDALLPVLLTTRLVADSATRADLLRSLDALLLRAAPPARRDLRRLFDLLNGGATRWLCTGVRKPWREASPAEIERFLDRWRNSRIALFNSGYLALSRLCATPFFGSRAGRLASGYPGPPDWIVAALSH